MSLDAAGIASAVMRAVTFNNVCFINFSFHFKATSSKTVLMFFDLVQRASLPGGILTLHLA